MSAIRFKHVGFGCVVAGAAMAAVACSSEGASSAPGGGTGGGVYMGAGGGGGVGGAVVGAGGSVVGAGGAKVGAGGAVVGAGGAVVGAGGAVVGTGGGVSVGGMTGTGTLKITGSVTACGTPPPPPAGSVSACTLTGCTAAHCVPKAQIPAGANSALLAQCPDGSFCTPDDYIATSGQFLPKTCKSLLGAEGRCISKCVPQVNTQLATLPPDTCAPSELCAPCFNPLDSTDTHACDQGCDKGAANKTPVVFVKCGGPANLGVCVPPSLVTAPSQQTALKGIDNPDGKCADGTSLCAPVQKAANQAFKFAPCASTSLGYTLSGALPSGQKAACVPYYLVPSGKLGLVDAGDCPQPAGAPTGKGFICAPCLDPTAGNASTGACD